MKVKEGFVLRQVVDNWIVLPLAEETLNLSGMLKLNESGVMLWKLLEQGCNRQDLACLLLSEYAISEEQADADVDEFLNKLIQCGCIEND